MIRLIKPYITFEEVKEEFLEIFETGYFTKGKYVEQFREAIRKYTGAKYSFLTTSATTALSVCLKILNISVGDEVIVSDFSFPATVNVVEDLGAKPVFADVNLDTFNMLPEELERKITQKTKAVIFVDTFGNPSGIHQIKSICQRYELPLIEDAACAIGSSEYDIKCGNISDFTCFSFHPRKLLTTGEGGAITTNHTKYAEKLEIKLNHGSVCRNEVLDFVDYGYNYRMPELQAIMGIKQLKKLDYIVRFRNKIKESYKKCLLPWGYKIQKQKESVIHNVQSLVFVVPSRINRDFLVKNLKKADIESTIGTYCLSGTTYYANKYNNIQRNAQFLEKNTITLPCYEGIPISSICDVLLAGACTKF